MSLVVVVAFGCWMVLEMVERVDGLQLAVALPVLLEAAMGCLLAVALVLGGAWW